MNLGQDVYFLGFPFGLGSRFNSEAPITFPFIKKGIVSALDRGGVFYIDGHNNPGFSGGPVIFADFSKRNALTIAGVISGYRAQPQRVLVLKEPSASSPGKQTESSPRFVLENTGIVVAHSIAAIQRAIRAHPVGAKPSRQNPVLRVTPTQPSRSTEPGSDLAI